MVWARIQGYPRDNYGKKEITKIIYIRIDTGHVDGVFNTDGYIDGTKYSPQQTINTALEICIKK